LLVGEEMIRKEIVRDIQDIRQLNDLVFSSPVEGTIVDAIRKRSSEVLSMVAVVDDKIVGHVFFSPVEIDGLNSHQAFGLGPMAVLSEYQRQGIGSGLVTQGIKQLQELGCAAVVVLGLPEYYPKFGFSPAGKYGLKCEWDGIPDDTFMLRFLKKEYEGVVRGTVRYMKEFRNNI
jgi:putative acetyltransferase